MLLAVAMVSKPEAVSFECLSRDKDYYNSDEMVYRRKHKCGCEQFCCINTATLTVSGLANFNGASVNVRNQLNVNGVNVNNLLGIAGTAGINSGSGAVGLVDAEGAQTNSGGATGLGLTTFANYYSTADDDILSAGAIPFASAGPVAGISRSSVGTDINFVLPAIGTYEITWFATLLRAATGNIQLSLYNSTDNGTTFTAIGGQTVAGAAFDTTLQAYLQVFGTALVTTTVANTQIQVRNTSGVTVTPVASAAGSLTAGLTIKRIA